MTTELNEHNRLMADQLADSIVLQANQLAVTIQLEATRKAMERHDELIEAARETLNELEGGLLEYLSPSMADARRWCDRLKAALEGNDD